MIPVSKITLLTALGGCIFLSCGSEERPTSPEGEGTPTSNSPDNPEPSGNSQEFMDGAFFYYSDVFWREAHFSFHEYGVDFFTREIYDDIAYQWQKSVSTSFAIEAIDDRTSNEVVVGGLDEQSGEVVIELWTFPAPAGSYATRRFPSVTGSMGVPMLLTGEDEYTEGGTFIPPEDRTVNAPPQRVVLYRGTGLQGIRALKADPDRRFVLVQDSGTGSVHQLYGQQLHMLLDVQSFPLLLDNNLGGFFQKSTTDRVHLTDLRGNGVHDMIVLHDPNNDGIFDPPVQMTWSQAIQQYPIEPHGAYE